VTSVGGSAELTSKSSNISGENVNVSSDLTVDMVNSNIVAENNVNVDTAMLNMVGLFEQIGVEGEVEIGVTKVNDEYKLVLTVSGGAHASTATSSITAGNEVGGNTLVIISLNGDIESVVNGSGVENNFNPNGGLLPIIVDEDVNLDFNEEGSTSLEIGFSGN
jgi:hypothetical protein